MGKKVIRWMGKRGWGFKQGRAVVTHYTGKDPKGDDLISDATVRAQLLGGRTGERGIPAPLTEEQAAELERVKAGG